MANALRGAGTYFGPDVTSTFLQKNKMSFIVRSHECKPGGYEIMHNGNVSVVIILTIFIYKLELDMGLYMYVLCLCDTS